MLWLIFKNINPTNQVVILNMKYAMEHATLHKYSNNVVVILENIQQNLEEHKNRVPIYDYFLRHMLQYLMKTTKFFIWDSFREMITTRKPKVPKLRKG